MIRRRHGKRIGGTLLEVCVETPEDAMAAAAGGAGRIELNAALALGGLTPSPGLMQETRRAVRSPVIAMARPRGGDFFYSEREFRALRRDVDAVLALGADGVAFGILTSDGRVNGGRCRSIVRDVGPEVDLVFHRAFDSVADPFVALEAVIDLGFRRVMTSGGKPTAANGAGIIRRLVRQAAGRIEILPAGGVRPGNAMRILSRTGCDQLHTSLRDRDGRMSGTMLAEMAKGLQ